MMIDHPDFFRPADHGKLLCTLCPRACELSEGQRGLCFIRQCKDHRIELTSYGRSSGFAIDPVEKKPLYHFYPGSSVLSFGTTGCNLSCKFCQNWDMSKSRQMDTLQASASPHQIAEMAIRNKCQAVAFTYNDPVVFYEYAVDTAFACQELGIETIAVTAGYMNRVARPGFFRYMQAANVDLKGFSEAFYQRLCGGSLAPVQETLLYLVHETDVWVEITNLIIPGENDSASEIEALCAWIGTELGTRIPLHFSAFHPDYKLRKHPRTTLASLQSAARIATAKGLEHVYLGNVNDMAGSTTYCPTCRQPVIKRSGYTVETLSLDSEGHCQSCGGKIAGHFQDLPQSPLSSLAQ